jgi:hypothetical protein
MSAAFTRAPYEGTAPASWRRSTRIASASSSGMRERTAILRTVVARLLEAPGTACLSSQKVYASVSRREARHAGRLGTDYGKSLRGHVSREFFPFTDYRSGPDRRPWRSASMLRRCRDSVRPPFTPTSNALNDSPTISPMIWRNPGPPRHGPDAQWPTASKPTSRRSFVPSHVVARPELLGFPWCSLPRSAEPVRAIASGHGFQLESDGNS